MEDQWYYSEQKQRMGPVSEGQLKQLASTGQLKPTDLVWKKGMASWRAASEVVGLFPPSISAEPPPLPLDGLPQPPPLAESDRPIKREPAPPLLPADFLSPDLVNGAPRPTPDNSRANKPKDIYDFNEQKRAAMAILEEMWKGGPAKTLFDKDWRHKHPVATGVTVLLFFVLFMFCYTMMSHSSGGGVSSHAPKRPGHSLPEDVENDLIDLYVIEKDVLDASSRGDRAEVERLKDKHRQELEKFWSKHGHSYDDGVNTY